VSMSTYGETHLCARMWKLEVNIIAVSPKVGAATKKKPLLLSAPSVLPTLTKNQSKIIFNDSTIGASQSKQNLEVAHSWSQHSVLQCFGNDHK
jgi:hypothetical protein